MAATPACVGVAAKLQGGLVGSRRCFLFASGVNRNSGARPQPSASPVALLHLADTSDRSASAGISAPNSPSLILPLRSLKQSPSRCVHFRMKMNVDCILALLFRVMRARLQCSRNPNSDRRTIYEQKKSFVACPTGLSRRRSRCVRSANMKLRRLQYVHRPVHVCRAGFGRQLVAVGTRSEPQRQQHRETAIGTANAVSPDAHLYGSVPGTDGPLVFRHRPY